MATKTATRTLKDIAEDLQRINAALFPLEKAALELAEAKRKNTTQRVVNPTGRAGRSYFEDAEFDEKEASRIKAGIEKVNAEFSALVGIRRKTDAEEIRELSIMLGNLIRPSQSGSRFWSGTKRLG